MLHRLESCWCRLAAPSRRRPHRTPTTTAFHPTPPRTTYPLPGRHPPPPASGQGGTCPHSTRYDDGSAGRTRPLGLPRCASTASHRGYSSALRRSSASTRISAAEVSPTSSTSATLPASTTPLTISPPPKSASAPTASPSPRTPPPSHATLQAIIAWLESEADTGTDQAVYLHGAAGFVRTPTIAAALLLQHHLPLDEAIRIVLAARPEAQIPPAHRLWLRQVEARVEPHA